MNECNKNEFQYLTKYLADNNKEQPVLCEDITQAIHLYNNAKFYLQATELQGALVSYSCAAILLDSIRRNLQKIFQIKGNLQPVAQAPSSNTGVDTGNEDSQTSEESKSDVSEAESQSPSINNSDILSDCEKMLNCSLNAVEDLQKKVKSLGGSSNKKEDEEEKDWDKICVKHNPLTFQKGSENCLFFSDVIGLKNEKKMIESSLIYPLVYPNLYPKSSKGILIYGPPGTGKTYIVKAAVNELQSTDPTVGVLFFAPSPGDLKGKYVGETEKRIEEVFHCASDAACRYETKDCVETKKKYISIIFMDEMDAIGPNRDRDTTGLAANSVNTLLQMMDGINSFQNVCVVAATNYPWNLDDAILRRFDTQVLVDVPTENDLYNLMNYEMKNYIKLEADKTKFSYCDGKKNDKKGENKKTLCELECERKVIKDLYSVAPYNKLTIDFFEEIKGKNNIISEITGKIAKLNFSNSDLSRLMKAAGTNAGELAIKSNLFYSTKIIDDYNTNKFISCLARLRDEKKGILKSIELLSSFLINTELDSDFYQAKKPKYAYIIGNDDYYYFNVKCLFYKNNDIILDEPMLNDIYIKFCNRTNVKQLATREGAESWREHEDSWINLYKKNILGYKVNSIKPDDLTYIDTDFVKTEKTKKYVNSELSMIITASLNFNQTSNQNIESVLLPRSSVLITCVSDPIYNLYKNIQTTCKQYNRIKADSGFEWLTKTYNIENPDEAGLNSPIYNIGEDQNANPNFLSPYLKKIINIDMATDKSNFEILTKNNFTDIRFHNLDFYNYLLLKKVVEGRGRNPRGNRLQSLETELARKRDELEKLEGDSKGGVKNPEMRSISERIAELEGQISEARRGQAEGEEPVPGQQRLFQEYEDIFKQNPDNPEINITDISRLDINQNDDDFTNKLRDKTYISVTLTKKIKRLGSDPESSTETLLYNNDKSNPQYIISVNEFKKLIVNRNIYDNLNYQDQESNLDDLDLEHLQPAPPGQVAPGQVAPVEDSPQASELVEADDNKYLAIHKEFFEIIFKDIFEIKQGFFDPYTLKNVLFFDNILNKLTQLYINDTINLFSFVRNAFPQKISNPYTMLTEYLNMLCLNPSGENSNEIIIMNSIALRVYDNFKFSSDITNPEFYILGQNQGNINLQQGGKKNTKYNKINKPTNNNKSLKSKKYYNKKNNKTFRSNISYGGVKTESSTEIRDNTETPYTHFVTFCISSVSKPQNNNDIVEKEIFLQVLFDLKEIRHLRRHGGLIDLFYGIGSSFKWLSDLVKSRYDSGKEALEKELISKFQADFQEMKQKKQILATLFKKISAIGFLVEHNDNPFSKVNQEDIPQATALTSSEITIRSTGQQDNATTERNQLESDVGNAGQEAEQEVRPRIGQLNDIERINQLIESHDVSGAPGVPLQVQNISSTQVLQGRSNKNRFLNLFGKTTYGDLTIKNPVINWIPIFKINNIFSDMYRLIFSLTKENTKWNASWMTILAASVSGCITTGATGAPLALAGGYLATQIILQINDLIQINNVTQEYIIDNLWFSLMYDIIFKIGFINVETLRINPAILLIKEVEDAYNKAAWTIMANGTVSIMQQESYVSFKDRKPFTTNIISVTNKYIKLFGEEIKKPSAQQSQSLISGITSWFTSTTPTDMEIRNTGKKIDQYTYSVKLFSVSRYDDNKPDPRSDIKTKLKNVNIPLSSFYYALSIVKSTYNPETGKMLKEYYADKAKFMKDYEAKLKK